MAQAPGRVLGAPCGVRSHRDGAGGCKASCRGGLSWALLEWLRATNPGTPAGLLGRGWHRGPQRNLNPPATEVLAPREGSTRGECRSQEGCAELSRSASVQRPSPPTSGPDLEPCAPGGRLPAENGEKHSSAHSVRWRVKHCSPAHAKRFTHTS